MDVTTEELDFEPPPKDLGFSENLLRDAAEHGMSFWKAHGEKGRRQKFVRKNDFSFLNVQRRRFLQEDDEEEEEDPDEDDEDYDEEECEQEEEEKNEDDDFEPPIFQAKVNGEFSKTIKYETFIIKRYEMKKDWRNYLHFPVTSTVYCGWYQFMNFFQPLGLL